MPALIAWNDAKMLPTLVCTVIKWKKTLTTPVKRSGLLLNMIFQQEGVWLQGDQSVTTTQTHDNPITIPRAALAQLTSFASLTSLSNRPHFASSSLKDASSWAFSTFSLVTVFSNWDCFITTKKNPSLTHHNSLLTWLHSCSLILR